MPQDPINSVLVEYFCEDYLCLRSEFSFLMQWLSPGSTLGQFDCVQLLPVELQFLKGEAVMLDDLDIGELKTHIKRANFKLVSNLIDYFEEGAVGGELLLEDLQGVVIQTAVVVDSKPY
jgi:hypothetical protein